MQLEVEEKMYTAIEVVDEMNGLMSYRQLDHWARFGFVLESGRQPGRTGSGYVRLFTVQSLRKIRVMAILVSAGVHASRASEYADAAIAAYEERVRRSERRGSRPQKSIYQSTVIPPSGGVVITIDVRLPEEEVDD